ncbi:MAG: class F sortase [Candidatus Saccharimonadales bacterium]
MKKPVKLKRILLVGLVVGIAVLSTLLSSDNPPASAVSLDIPPETEAIMESPGVIHSKPTRLLIPTLSIDADIAHVGLTSDGDMEAPEKLSDAGWYQYGSHPGDEGNAVIAGHVGGLKTPGVFANLHKLQIGEHFSVVDEQGQNVHFTVMKIKTYAQDDRPDEVFRSKAGQHLNLITCTGAWNEQGQTYADRLVVFADKTD